MIVSMIAKKICARSGCKKEFAYQMRLDTNKESKYCSMSCAAQVNKNGRARKVQQSADALDPSVGLVD